MYARNPTLHTVHNIEPCAAARVYDPDGLLPPPERFTLVSQMFSPESLPRAWRVNGRLQCVPAANDDPYVAATATTMPSSVLPDAADRDCAGGGGGMTEEAPQRRLPPSTSRGDASARTLVVSVVRDDGTIWRSDETDATTETCSAQPPLQHVATDAVRACARVLGHPHVLPAAAGSGEETANARIAAGERQVARGRELLDSLLTLTVLRGFAHVYWHTVYALDNSDDGIHATTAAARIDRNETEARHRLACRALSLDPSASPSAPLFSAATDADDEDFLWLGARHRRRRRCAIRAALQSTPREADARALSETVRRWSRSTSCQACQRDAEILVHSSGFFEGVVRSVSAMSAAMQCDTEAPPAVVVGTLVGVYVDVERFVDIVAPQHEWRLACAAAFRSGDGRSFLQSTSHQPLASHDLNEVLFCAGETLRVILSIHTAADAAVVPGTMRFQRLASTPLHHDAYAFGLHLRDRQDRYVQHLRDRDEDTEEVAGGSGGLLSTFPACTEWLPNLALQFARSFLTYTIGGGSFGLATSASRMRVWTSEFRTLANGGINAWRFLPSAPPPARAALPSTAARPAEASSRKRSRPAESVVDDKDANNGLYGDGWMPLPRNRDEHVILARSEREYCRRRRAEPPVPVVTWDRPDPPRAARRGGGGGEDNDDDDTGENGEGHGEDDGEDDDENEDARARAARYRSATEDRGGEVGTVYLASPMQRMRFDKIAMIVDATGYGKTVCLIAYWHRRSLEERWSMARAEQVGACGWNVLPSTRLPRRISHRPYTLPTPAAAKPNSAAAATAAAAAATNEHGSEIFPSPRPRWMRAEKHDMTTACAEWDAHMSRVASLNRDAPIRVGASGAETFAQVVQRTACAYGDGYCPPPHVPSCASVTVPSRAAFIYVPRQLTRMWRDEIRRCVPDASVLLIDTPQDARRTRPIDVVLRYDYVILNRNVLAHREFRDVHVHIPMHVAERMGWCTPRRTASAGHTPSRTPTASAATAATECSSSLNPNNDWLPKLQWLKPYLTSYDTVPPHGCCSGSGNGSGGGAAAVDDPAAAHPLSPASTRGFHFVFTLTYSTPLDAHNTEGDSHSTLRGYLALHSALYLNQCAAHLLPNDVAPLSFFTSGFHPHMIRCAAMVCDEIHELERRFTLVERGVCAQPRDMSIGITATHDMASRHGFFGDRHSDGGGWCELLRMRNGVHGYLNSVWNRQTFARYVTRTTGFESLPPVHDHRVDVYLTPDEMSIYQYIAYALASSPHVHQATVNAYARAVERRYGRDSRPVRQAVERIAAQQRQQRQQQRNEHQQSFLTIRNARVLVRFVTYHELEDNHWMNTYFATTQESVQSDAMADDDDTNNNNGRTTTTVRHALFGDDHDDRHAHMDYTTGQYRAVTAPRALSSDVATTEQANGGGNDSSTGTGTGTGRIRSLAELGDSFAARQTMRIEKTKDALRHFVVRVVQTYAYDMLMVYLTWLYDVAVAAERPWPSAHRWLSHYRRLWDRVHVCVEQHGLREAVHGVLQQPPLFHETVLRILQLVAAAPKTTTSSTLRGAPWTPWTQEAAQSEFRHVLPLHATRPHTLLTLLSFHALPPWLRANGTAAFDVVSTMLPGHAAASVAPAFAPAAAAMTCDEMPSDHEDEEGDLGDQEIEGDREGDVREDDAAVAGRGEGNNAPTGAGVEEATATPPASVVGESVDDDGTADLDESARVERYLHCDSTRRNFQTTEDAVARIERRTREAVSAMAFRDAVVRILHSSDDIECPVCCGAIDRARTVVTRCGHLLCAPCVHDMIVTAQQTSRPAPKCPTCLTTDLLGVVVMDRTRTTSDAGADSTSSSSPSSAAAAEKSSADGAGGSVHANETYRSIRQQFGSKMARLVQLLAHEIPSHEKVILLAQFDKVRRFLGGALAKLGMRDTFVYIEGSSHHCHANLQRFRTDPRVRFCLLSCEHANASETIAGLRLEVANHVVIVHPLTGDTHQAWQQETQAIGRALRIGQTREVHVHRLVTSGTVEEGLHAAQAQYRQFRADHDAAAMVGGA